MMMYDSQFSTVVPVVPVVFIENGGFFPSGLLAHIGKNF